ncbi:MAG: transcriptional regulator PpsR [Pseudomonadota bacterium]
MKNFAAPQQSLGDINAEAAARLIATAADIALVVDADGLIRDLAVDHREFALTGHETWRGRPWVETVTEESRPKIEALIQEALTSDRTRWRQVNHPTATGTDVPVLYSALRIGRDQRLVAFGRDLRTISSLQQRLIEAQHKLEHDYTRLRHLETRYRLLFQLSDEPLLVVDGASDKVLEANRAALRMLEGGTSGLVGRPFAHCVDSQHAGEVDRLLATVRATGRADEAELKLSGRSEFWRVSASLLRQESTWVFLVRLLRLDDTVVTAPRYEGPDWTEIVSRHPDGFVLTRPDGTIIACNPAFLEMAEIPTEDQTRGDTLDRWLGRPGVDLRVLLANLREHGTVRLFATTLRGDYGSETEVEISACASGEPSSIFAFSIRDVRRRFGTAAGSTGMGGALGAVTSATRQPVMAPSADQLGELVGRVSLKDLVRQTTEMIEKMYIEAALEMTNDNRASAAEMLGLSRQSLYVKLRRFGRRDLSDNEDSGAEPARTPGNGSGREPPQG